MARVYSNYTEQEILLLRRDSEQMGFSSLSAYQKYRTLLSLTDNNTIGMADLIQKMKDGLAAKQAGDVFIVSSLLPNEWVSLSRSQKITLSKALRKIVNENPKAYQVNDVLPGKINQYIVLGGQ